jgi:hypothetical protein
MATLSPSLEGAGGGKTCNNTLISLLILVLQKDPGSGNLFLMAVEFI